MILVLSLSLIERLGLIIIFAFFISKTAFFKNYIIKAKSSLSENIFFAVLWGILGISMTMLGTPVSGGIANSRTIPIVLSGLLGGPLVGGISGLIAGVHRAFFVHTGELTAISCGISTLLGGLIGGYAKKFVDRKNNKWMYGLFVGLAVELLQMAIILMIARPYSEALNLVKIIFIPMTFLNAAGISMFLLFIEQILDEHENIAALKAQMALKIADQTLLHLKKGLNRESATSAAEIIKDITEYDAVSITDMENVLVHVGEGSDHHKAGGKIWTDITKKALQSGESHSATNKSKIGCDNPECMLKSVVVAPLRMNERTIGVLKIYKCDENSISKSDIELVKGLGVLFSTQLNLANIETQKTLREEAELKALRAQIRPHFLFNSLNAIMSITRTNPEKARTLLQELSIFLRTSFKNMEPFIPLEEELRFIEAYLNIEKARFPDKLIVEYDVDEDLEIMIPPLLAQPLVENAVKHGIGNKLDKGTVKITIKDAGNYVSFLVEDDGAGFDNKEKHDINMSNGVGLANVISRLRSIYNEELIIFSEEDKGTRISFKIPKVGGII